MNSLYKKILRDNKIVTIDNVYEIQKKVLPVFNTGRLLNCSSYHFNGRTYGYKYSADYPEDTFGIISVENMPYASRFDYRSDQSIISRLDALIFDNKVQPILLFINGRFVKWENIDVVYDCGNVWFKLYGDQYNYHNINKIDMMVLPFNISYIAVESQYSFDKYYEAVNQFILDSAVSKIINGVKRLTVRIPRINDIYVAKDGTSMNVGIWYYNQLKLYFSGILSNDRINKLKKIHINKTIYNDNNTAIEQVFSNTINLLDKDSIIKAQLDEVMNITPESITNNTIFRFDNEGLLDEDGDTIITLLDSYDYGKENNILFRKKTFSLNPNESTEIDYMNSDIGNILFRNNFIVFRDGLLCNGDNIISLNNYGEEYSDINLPTNGYILTNTFEDPYNRNAVYTIDGHEVKPEDKKYVFDVLLFYNKDVPIVNHLMNKIPNTSALIEDINAYFSSTESNRKTNHLDYIDSLLYALSYKYGNNTVLEGEQGEYANAFNKIINYDLSLFNELYDDINVYKSTTFTGRYVNDNLITEGFFGRSDDWAYTLNIPRIQTEYHQCYVMIFVNGILITEYENMRVFFNKFCLPLKSKFVETDTIEILYFNNCNNNEIQFTIESKENINRYINTKYFNLDELNIFTGSYQVDKRLLTYPDMVYNENNIAFKIPYKIEGENITLNIENEDLLYNKPLIMTSKNKFIYQKLTVDKKCYKILLDKRFRYCDNQLQYILYINGRKMNHHDYLISIPRFSRPFDTMYLYTSKFVNPDDRIELFYTPLVCNDIAYNNELVLNSTGYINLSNVVIDYPFNKNNYIIFIDGMKISPADMIDINSNIIKISKDYFNMNNLSIIPLFESNPYYELYDYFKHEKCNWDTAIDKISGQVDKLNILFNNLTELTHKEHRDFLSPNVGRIAIINEIVRDFWVANGYDYNKDVFVYDYYVDEDAIKYDEATGSYILPAMDAQDNINIIKYELYHLWFTYNGHVEFYEMGTIINALTLQWEYNDPYDNLHLKYQKINGVAISNSNRNYTITTPIKENTTFTLESFDGYDVCTSTCNIKFANGIYYGLIDEDLIDGRESDIYSSHPTDLLRVLNKKLTDKAELDLSNYVIGNNKYLIIALPKSMVYDDKGNMIIKFYLPDINSEEVIKANRDDHTIPILTNGNYNKYNNLVSLEELTMDKFIEFDFNNSTGNHMERYVIFKTNGYFTRLYEKTTFDIYVK